MPKDTKKTAKVKKANPILEDENELEDEEAETETDTEIEDTDEADEADEESEDEVEDEEPKAKAKGKTARPIIERDVVKTRGANSVEAEMRKDIENVKASLEKQDKVRIFIPLGIGEKKGSKGAFDSVTINGYRMVFPKGEYVTVPQAVADIIEAHYNMTPENTEAGEAFRLDRVRTKEDGLSTEDALS